MALDECFQNVLKSIRQKDDTYIRIAIIGQAGAGKSSIINALMGRKAAETGQGTDTTKVVTSYDYTQYQKLADFPGYGTEKISYETWASRFHPEQYDVFIYVFKEKFSQEDDRLFLDLKKWGNARQKPLILVRNVSENLNENQKQSLEEDLSKHMKQDIRNSILFVSCRTKTDIDKLKARIYTLDVKKIRCERIKQTFNEQKNYWLNCAKSAAEGKISSYSKGAAVNGVNPVLGADIAIDAGIYLSMFSSIRGCYDIKETDFTEYMAIPIAKKMIDLLSKQGVIILIKNFAGKQTAKTILKYVPLIGQVTSAGLGYIMAASAGEDYSMDCYRFSEKVMDRLIDEEIEKLDGAITRRI